MVAAAQNIADQIKGLYIHLRNILVIVYFDVPPFGMLCQVMVILCVILSVFEKNLNSHFFDRTSPTTYMCPTGIGLALSLE